MLTPRARHPWVVLLVAGLLAGCGLSRSAPLSIPLSRPERSALSDANIVALLVATNTTDVLHAELALAKSRDPDVHAFAMMSKKDDESVNAAATALARDLKWTVAEDDASFAIRSDAEGKRLAMRALEGFTFDTAYVAYAMRFHRTLLGTIDDAFLRDAQRPELRALLTQVRPAEAAHLDHAMALMAKLVARAP